MALQTFTKGGQLHRVLSYCPCINTAVQKRNFFFKDRKIQITEDIYNWINHDYKFNIQELTAYRNKRYLEEIKKHQLYDIQSVTNLGLDLAAASVVLRTGGKVKFVDDEVWYKKFENGSLPIPREYDEQYKLEGVDTSRTVFLIETLNNLRGLKHLRYVNLSKSKFVDDWYIEKLVELCPEIEALDISDCPYITDNGLEMLRNFRNLKVVNVTHCHRIKCGEVVCTLLEEFCPNLNVVGLKSLPKFTSKEEFQAYEQRSSRYLNWGYIMNTRLGLDNDIDFDEFFKAQMEKVFNEDDNFQSSHKEGEEATDITKSTNEQSGSTEKASESYRR